MIQYLIKIFFFGIMLLFITSCGSVKYNSSSEWKVNYIDDYIIPENTLFEGTLIGGLSDLDYDGNYFYAVCDLPSSPRIYQFKIAISQNKIDSVYFTKVIPILGKDQPEKNAVWDSEGLLYDAENNTFIISSEGSIKNNRNPFIAVVDTLGQYEASYQIPSYFKAQESDGLRNNGVFEGLTWSADKKGIWVSTELPMKKDGPTAKLYKTKSPIRVTLLDRERMVPEYQFSYLLDPIRKFPILPFGMNGVSALLNYAEKKFLVLERGFSAGHGSHGIRARLFEADAARATNTLHISDLKGEINSSVIPAEKKLIFDFKKIRKKLSQKTVDNLEGISFGPILPNGNPSLIVISDNNFSSWTRQINQVILLELIPQKN